VARRATDCSRTNRFLTFDTDTDTDAGLRLRDFGPGTLPPISLE
jgi:hypothetical protein